MDEKYFKKGEVVVFEHKRHEYWVVSRGNHPDERRFSTRVPDGSIEIERRNIDSIDNEEHAKSLIINHVYSTNLKKTGRVVDYAEWRGKLARTHKEKILEQRKYEEQQRQHEMNEQMRLYRDHGTFRNQGTLITSTSDSTTNGIGYFNSWGTVSVPSIINEIEMPTPKKEEYLEFKKRNIKKLDL